MPGPQNGIMGDEDYGLELPQSDVNSEDLREVEKLAKFSKSKEYKRLKEHFDDRISYFQSYLPDGRPVASVPKAELEGMWVAANVIIGEFKSVMAIYEQAEEAIKEARSVRRKGA
jgi:hypothetical protein